MVVLSLDCVSQCHYLALLSDYLAIVGCFKLRFGRFDLLVNSDSVVHVCLVDFHLTLPDDFLVLLFVFFVLGCYGESDLL